jgi:hypothetical protein
MERYKKMNLRDLLKPTLADDRNKFSQVIKRKGSWKQAITHRAGGVKPKGEAPKEQDRRRRNFNDFIKSVPVVVVPKDTELLHMSGTSNWIGSSMIGGNKKDGYSFFTLAASGMATTHASQFAAMFRMKLKKDTHIFFMPTYSLLSITKNTHNRVEHSTPDKGGGAAATVLQAFPPEWAPVGMAGHSEHELFFYNHSIPKIMEPVRVAKLKDTGGGIGDDNLTDLAPEEIFTTDKGNEPGIGTAWNKPDWMGTSRHHHSHKTMHKKYAKAYNYAKKDSKGDLKWYEKIAKSYRNWRGKEHPRLNNPKLLNYFG